MKASSFGKFTARKKIAEEGRKRAPPPPKQSILHWQGKAKKMNKIPPMSGTAAVTEFCMQLLKPCSNESKLPQKIKLLLLSFPPPPLLGSTSEVADFY